MELWEIKANALRLMFADSDMNFDRNEFSDKIVYANGNTRDKLVRMNDSIRRAIDLYYQYTGSYSRKTYAKYLTYDGRLTNVLDLSHIKDFDSPTRIDLLPSFERRVYGQQNLNYFFDNITKDIEVDFREFHLLDASKITSLDVDRFVFQVFYSVKKVNLPSDEDLDEMTFNLDSINIPDDIQRMIPKYIKGELYEEDEHSLAMVSKDEYIRYLISYPRKFSNVQTKVKSNFKRG